METEINFEDIAHEIIEQYVFDSSKPKRSKEHKELGIITSYLENSFKDFVSTFEDFDEYTVDYYVNNVFIINRGYYNDIEVYTLYNEAKTYGAKFENYIKSFIDNDYVMFPVEELGEAYNKYCYSKREDIEKKYNMECPGHISIYIPGFGLSQYEKITLYEQTDICADYHDEEMERIFIYIDNPVEYYVRFGKDEFEEPGYYYTLGANLDQYLKLDNNGKVDRNEISFLFDKNGQTNIRDIEGNWIDIEDIIISKESKFKPQNIININNYSIQTSVKSLRRKRRIFS